MEIVATSLLALGAFGLGSVPFSLLLGRWLLHDDIRNYADGNPGATNVFRAGSYKAGFLAVALDVGKGVPFVYLSHAVFDLRPTMTVAIALCAILGHAFSPFLQWHGGKAVAITFGVLLALPQPNLLVTFIVFMALGALFIEVDAWEVIFGAAGTAAFYGITRGNTWETLLITCIMAVLVVKHFAALHAAPGFKGRLVRWVQAVVRNTMSII